MDILEVSSPRSFVCFDSEKLWSSNRVTLLTGPNGSGKTEILTVLASAFRAKKRPANGNHVRWRRDNKIFDTDSRYDGAEEYPRRIITQTFSPFSRFPAALKSRTTLTDVYSEGKISENRYVAVGFHRSSRVWGTHVTRQTLKEAIYRLSESVNRVGVISQVLLHLGYRAEIRFRFESLPQMDSVQSNPQPRRAALVLLEQVSNRASKLKFKAPLLAELKEHGIEGLAELIVEAIRILSRYEQEESCYEFRAQFTSERRFTDFSVIQSFALLERLHLLRLDSCLLTRDADGETMDAANASSGQQQMLCSVIGLVTALQDDSLVLIDEPELSLHPQWQQLFLEYLQAALRPFRDCHVFVATHSPLIVQRARALGTDVVTLGRRELTEPKGAADDSVEETLMDVFETPVPYSSHLANKVFGLVSRVEEEALEQSHLKPSKAEAEAELEALQRLYRSAPVRDAKSLALLDDALELVRMDPYGYDGKSKPAKDE